MGKGAFGRRHLRNSGRPGYGDRWVSCTGKPADVDNGGLAAAVAGTLLGFRAREGVCVCAHTQGGFGVCVRVEGGGAWGVRGNDAGTENFTTRESNAGVKCRAIEMFYDGASHMVRR